MDQSSGPTPSKPHAPPPELKPSPGLQDPRTIHPSPEGVFPDPTDSPRNPSPSETDPQPSEESRHEEKNGGRGMIDPRHHTTDPDL